MNLNLSDSGTELMANAKNVHQVLDDALKKCFKEVEKVAINESNFY
jgi:hypothetical protein